jgi:hypothetical protein
MNELNEYWNWTDGLPEHLREIVCKYWDETGRPTTLHTKNDVVLAVLNTSGSIDGKTFVNDIKLIFREMSVEEAAIYYNCFIAGANHLANMLDKSKN